MQKKDTALAASQIPLPRSARERIGLLVDATDAAAAAAAIVAAEAASVRQVWMTQFTAAPDTLAIFAAAAVQTTKRAYGNGYCAHISTSSTVPGAAGPYSGRPCSRAAAPGDRAKPPPNHRGILWHPYDGSIGTLARVRSRVACDPLGGES